MNAETAFWSCLLLLAYSHAGYPLVLFLAYAVSQIRRDSSYLLYRQNRRAADLSGEELPQVTMVVPAHNEEVRLPAKIANLSQLDYPHDKLRIVIVSDGSTDRTAEILRGVSDPRVETVLLKSRRGKAVALNHAVSRARSEIVVFSDAATLFAPNALRMLVRHFADPSVGAVCGALQFQGSTESQKTEGVYWRYESILRLMEARLGATLTASGAIYALRKTCYRRLPPETIIEDFVVPMHARRLGFRVVYDPEARATEFAASNVQGEFHRRVRLAVGSFRALPEMARVPLDAFTCLAFFSHKLLRWVVPFTLLGLLVSNGLLWTAGPFYRFFFLAQVLFYAWGVAGYFLHERVHRVRFALLGYFLLAMNLAFLVGFFRYLAKPKEVKWQRVN